MWVEDRIRGRDYYLGKYYGFGENIMVSVQCTGAGGGTCRRPARRRRLGIAHSEGPRSASPEGNMCVSTHANAWVVEHGRTPPTYQNMVQGSSMSYPDGKSRVLVRTVHAVLERSASPPVVA